MLQNKWKLHCRTTANKNWETALQENCNSLPVQITVCLQKGHNCVSRENRFQSQGQEEIVTFSQE